MPDGNPYYLFRLELGATVGAKLFGITLAEFGMNAAFEAEGSGRTPITLKVKVKIKILFVTIK